MGKFTRAERKKYSTTATAEEDYTGNIIISLHTISHFVENPKILPDNCLPFLVSDHNSYAKNEHAEEEETQVCSGLCFLQEPYAV